MAARSIASLIVSFGLVSIPVKLFSATQSGSGVSFNLLHKDCGSRLKQQYICIDEGVVVERENMVKGYEFAPGQYVSFTPEELKALEEESTQTVEIAEFVPAEAIDPVYFDKPYYLAPDKGGDKPYSLLVAAMRQTNRTALARYAARGKQYLVQLRAVPEGLVMQQLHYADEVRTIDEVPIRKTEVKDPELKLAIMLIEQISSDQFNPAAYEDAVRKRIEEGIKQKIEGQQISVAPVAPAGGQVVDLMAALKATLEKMPKTEKRKPAKPAERAAPAAVAANEAKPRARAAKK